ncbi:N-acetylglucosamine-6-phosphate deacetylase [Lachnobacterium bovis]|uniref:N-acetylglucosamine-6-phosphate deacetylase n=1 Tax=Lachnobacterium bovis TaxID=140626 RepID=UPI000482156A|nr:N-acetylglucosamine-6-phosphate deacetylase [Lachnobacterium bovis]
MLLENVNAFLQNEGFKKVDIHIENEKIVDIVENTSPKEAEYNAIPGLCDIHFHGAMNHDFCDGNLEGLNKIGEFEAKNGVLLMAPATMTFDEERLNKIVDVANEYKNTIGKSQLVGINMEGPFISPQKIGAQNPKYIKEADIEMFLRLQNRAQGKFKIVDVAPEEKNAINFIKECSKDVRISIAHTCADYETAIKAFDNGASHITHIYNAMPGIHHRNPGPIIAAYEKNAEVELIADGLHVHPAVVRFTFDMFNEDKVILISDSMMACGLPDGEYELGAQLVTVKNSKATLTRDDSVLAGSVTNLYECMRRAIVEMKVQPEKAIKAATINPVKSIGLEKDFGSIEVGKYANIILTDSKYNLKKVLQKGNFL